MALLHQAQLHPSKLELLSDWVVNQPWFHGDAEAELSNVAAYRFDDPEGEVGVETILVRAGDGPTLQVPVTYRGSPLEGADSSLIGTMEHSVLGTRWVYDGVGDPVYVHCVASAVLNGGRQADLFVETDDGRVSREPTAVVEGTGTGESTIEVPSVSDLHISQVGSVTLIDTADLSVGIQRVIGSDVLGGDVLEGTESDKEARSSSETLMGTWTGSAGPHEVVRVLAS